MTSIFISHVEKTTGEIAQAFRDWIIQAYGQQTVRAFVSSADGIGSGLVPAEEIKHGLQTATAMIVLLSPNAFSNNWISFEVGAMIGRGKRVFPILCKGATVKDATSVFKTMVEMTDGASKRRFREVLDELDKIVGVKRNDGGEELYRKISAKPFIGIPVGAQRRWRG